MMKKTLLVFLLAMGLALASYSLVFADNGPHGGFAPATDACGGCHRTHTSTSAKLLIVSSTALCQTCHAATGTGADTNVMDGVYTNRVSGSFGVVGRGLKGGGFTNALMDTDDVAGAAAVSRVTTSSHTFNGTAGTAWGNGALGTVGAGASIALSCGSCHNPHGKAGTAGAATYRILRVIPTGSGAATGVSLVDPATKTYTISDATGSYWNDTYTNKDTLSAWCATCHTRYLAGAGSGSTASGDAIFSFRHMSNSTSVSCVDCHVGHGTASTMGVISGAVPWPGGATTPNGNARSAMLRLDNRGICYKCHATP
jgi:predicted CXXCH cytochrome family protein